MLQLVSFNSSLFEFFFSLILELIQVVGHSSVVLVRPSDGRFLQFLTWRLHLKDGFLDVLLDEILFLARLQLVDIVGLGYRALCMRSCMRLMLLLVRSCIVAIVVNHMVRPLTMLRVDDLLSRVLGSSILETAPSPQMSSVDGRMPFGRGWLWR